MIIRTFDGTEYIVNSEQGTAIKKVIMGDNPPDWIEIRDAMVRVSTISSIKPGGYTAADPEIKRLVDGQSRGSGIRIGEVESMKGLLGKRDG